jgi:PAS domain S-box-containing protein
MHLRLFKIPLGFLITGFLWALFSHPLLAALDKGFGLGTRGVISSINHFGFVGFVSVILYFQIKGQNKRLVDSEEQYRRLFESNPNPMWIYRTNDLRFVKVNQSALDLYGYNIDEFLAMDIMEIRPKAERERLKDLVRSLSPGTNNSGTWKHLKKNGGILYVSIVTYDLVFNGEICRLAMATNVTEMILKEEKIKTQNAALHDIAWSNSHEIRRSLCSVMSLTALLNDSANESERKEYIQLLQECTQDFDEILNKNNQKIDSLKED